MQEDGGMKRLVHWVLGDDWGIRSIDGSAPPNSVENRTNGIRSASRITGLTALLALIAIALVPLLGQHIEGLHVGWYFALSALALLIILPSALLAVRYLALWWIHLIVFLIEAVLMGTLAFTLGPVLSPYLVVPYAIYSTLDFVVMTRRMAMIHVAGIGASYGLVVALQAGNTAPVTRWLFAMGAVVIIGQTVASLVDRVRALAVSEHQARAATDQAKFALEDLNRTLERRVTEQVAELERLGRLRRFLSTPVVDAVLSSEGQRLLDPHQREISVFYCDLRGFSAFAENAEPEEVLGVLGEYFDLLGELITRYQATVGTFTGDGLMAFFNDPLPCDNPALRAITMAVEFRSAMEAKTLQWTRKGYELGFGIGITLGHASLGIIGFEGRRDYTAHGPMVNLSARLCSAAKSGQILIDQRALGASHESVEVEEGPSVELKGFSQPVPVFNVVGII
jgi:class 3 adenylate cyclase